ncbi:MAG TPA: carboxymuconolactone decarboxylase family protein [Vicinamibacterales bacterium]|nr:carboxymuconolactone decarboxylase family protein [Vicinamibacterales bacterium]
MQPRMTHPVLILPEAMKALHALHQAAVNAGLPESRIALVEVRASQLNGCGACLDIHTHQMKRAGESDERIFAVAAWRDTPYFSPAERATLALTEAVTRLADRADPVPDEIWAEAVRYYDERALAALLVAIAGINVWNRLNVATRQVTSAEAREAVLARAGASRAGAA